MFHAIGKKRTKSISPQFSINHSLNIRAHCSDLNAPKKTKLSSFPSLSHHQSQQCLSKGEKDLVCRDYISGNTLKWIQDFLYERTQKVALEGKFSSNKPVLSGVPQGSVLGPLLFLVYINDMQEGLSKDTKLKLFADDSLLYRKNKKQTGQYTTSKRS